MNSEKKHPASPLKPNNNSNSGIKGKFTKKKNIICQYIKKRTCEKPTKIRN